MASEAPQRNKVNKVLGKVCSKNWDNLDEPLKIIHNALESNGFKAEEGWYCGRDGKCHEQVGKNTWLVIQWHKISDHPHTRWEINAYVS
jgi:hypothetical protein